MTQPDISNLEFLKFLGRHLGCLVVEVAVVNKDGKDVGKSSFYTYSGFFIKVSNRTVFVTAGHIFKNTDGNGLQQLLARKAIRIVKANIADYFGPDAKIEAPTLIDYDDVLSNTVFINDDEMGLDFAFMLLRDFYAKSIAANGVVPFEEKEWFSSGNATTFAVVGFPDEEKSIDSIRRTMAYVNRCELPSHIPKPTYPYFAAKLPDDGPTSAKGLSGSPIIAIEPKDNKTEYWLVAIDVAWHKQERIIVGCPMTYIVASFLKLLAVFPNKL